MIAASANRLVVYNIKDREIYSEVVFDDATPREGSILQVCVGGCIHATIASVAISKDTHTYLCSPLYRL